MSTGQKIIDFIEEHGLCSVDYHNKEYYVWWLEDAAKLLTEFINKEVSPKNKEDLTCLFCNETGFDEIGLKSHFIHQDCDEYASVEIPKRHFLE